MMKKLLFYLSILINTLYASVIPINFKSIELSQLIQLTSKVMNKDILVAHEIKGKVNFSSNQLIEEKQLVTILKTALEQKGFELLEQKNFYVVNKMDAITSKVIEIKNANAKDILKVLTQHYAQSLKVSLLEDMNSVILMGSKREIKQAKNMIQQLDIPRLQVYVKTKIIELNNQKINDVGIRYGLFTSHSNSSQLLTFSSKLNGLGSNIPSNLSEFGLSLATSKSVLALGASINLLKQNHALNVISEPSILCLNNRESSIYVGETRSVKTASLVTDGGTSKDTFHREDIGLRLKVKPRVSSNQKVVLELTAILENFSQTNVTNNQPDTFKKEITTTAIVNNAQSVIIGGLIENKKEHVDNDVPFLSSIPLLGKLFEDNSDLNLKKNLTIIVTPYIISKSENLTMLRERLSQLESLEDEYLKNSLELLKEKSFLKKSTEVENLSSQNLHQQRVEKLLGY